MAVGIVCQIKPTKEESGYAPMSVLGGERVSNGVDAMVPKVEHEVQDGRNSYLEATQVSQRCDAGLRECMQGCKKEFKIVMDRIKSQIKTLQVLRVKWCSHVFLVGTVTQGIGSQCCHEVAYNDIYKFLSRS